MKNSRPLRPASKIFGKGIAEEPLGAAAKPRLLFCRFLRSKLVSVYTDGTGKMNALRFVDVPEVRPLPQPSPRWRPRPRSGSQPDAMNPAYSLQRVVY